jgi:3D (Asp-Asp-Asp) domain-containing protein
VRVGAPIVAAVALGFLLPVAGDADRVAQRQPEVVAEKPDAFDAYSRLTRRALALRDELRSAKLALVAARRSLDRSERRLGARLRALYLNGRPDPLEVVLGARSLDEAIASVEGLERVTREEATQVRQLRRARRAWERIVRRLRLQEAEAAALRRQAEAVLRLRAARRLSSRTAPSIPEAASELASPSLSPPQPSPGESGRLVVVALGYSIAGGTASGLPAGVGTVAVDPSVIPLGTTLTIPGYGRGVAADTGGAIRGAVIDLWFPTAEQARAWGRRVVTIEVHTG